ncbi:PAAR domain-containing protein [Burkholderia arboris]|uniref:PAAR domain-containing protein n=1 Tax=Burkholderia arboris TaxID=488730 RepID=UPI0009BDDB24|nr:PAAR domain-containing protein [Burkholderia arboris]MCA8491566.1 PAAR domain-containing protein [Burkholderia arboris]
MSKAVVCDGDPTTTGGRVIATASSMCDGDRRIALDHEMATCTKCPGEHPIQGSGTDMQENGRSSVLDGDLVLCPCGANHVKASSGSGCSTI